ncbi:SCO2584 family spore wall biosynthesis protein [Streptomyces sp. 6N223]|uniref:SCO2584 family spore wall biosynthesis protein n=1 Tax=Streptomyces sp. 6N223 TaxID=3457412 RepID=UPI003FD53A30
MPDDVRGQPFADGDGPDSQDRGAADEAFAAVVLDEDFVEAAAIHEPSAAERILYAALERAEAEATGDPPYYSEPDMDPGMGGGLGGMSDGVVDGVADYDYRFEEIVGPDAELEPEDPDDEEGRFDRSDYTRYMPDEDDEEELAYGGYTAYSAAASTPYAARSSGRSARYSSSTWRMARWQRPVACVLAMVMGISVIALALIAIQRAGSAQRGDPTPGPASPVGDTDQRPSTVVEAEIPEDG